MGYEAQAKKPIRGEAVVRWLTELHKVPNPHVNQAMWVFSSFFYRLDLNCSVPVNLPKVISSAKLLMNMM